MTNILDAIKESLHSDKRVTIKEASALTGSGAGVGGRVIYDDEIGRAHV